MFFYDQGCTGRIRLGDLPREIRSSLGEIPGEWLEYDAPTSAIVLRHTQPSSSPPLPTIAGELVRLLATVGPELQNGIPGGDIFIHPEEPGQLVRMRVDPGESLSLTRKNSPENRLTTTAASKIKTMNFIAHPKRQDRAV